MDKAPLERVRQLEAQIAVCNSVETGVNESMIWGELR